MTTPGGTRPTARIAYILHDLNAHDVQRRLAMLIKGGAQIDLYGFHRAPEPPESLQGIPVIPIGRTVDADMLGRIVSIMSAIFRLAIWGRRLRAADVVIARNLEALIVASVALVGRRRSTNLVYELLDVHRMLCGSGKVSKLVRSVEGFLLRGTSAVIVSSPAFVHAHLSRYDRPPPALLVENKVFLGDGAPPAPILERPPGPPWRIAWFGNLRCRESLLFLTSLARTLGDKVEIDLRGIISVSIQDIFEVETASLANVRYHGRYRYPEDLAEIYAPVHFVWAIDFYEKGANSTWLLPNRLYEGCYYGAVPIALDSVETGAWLARHDLGLVVPDLDSITTLIETMTAERYRSLAWQVANAGRDMFVCNDDECKALVDDLTDNRSEALEAIAL